jgi:Ca-activated chloride channel family protein
MLVTDHSGSMKATDVEPSRLEAAKRAARSFLNNLPAQIRVGVVAYSDTPDAVQAPSANHDDARHVIDQEIADGATATGDALQVAIDTLQHDVHNGRRPPSAIVLLSDGKTTAGRNPVEVALRAGKLHIPIHTVALGRLDTTIPNPDPFGVPLSVPPDPETLRAISKASGGRAFTAEDADQLNSTYTTLGSQLGVKKQPKEISASFAIGALALLLAAGTASLRWAGHLP